jgi:hypothetical protein
MEGNVGSLSTSSHDPVSVTEAVSLNRQAIIPMLVGQCVEGWL